MSDCIDHGCTTVTTRGYGQVWTNGQRLYAHRLAYCRHHGLDIESIKGLIVMHSCDNPRCVNPDHLSLGSNQDNQKDKVTKGRQATCSKHGQSKLSEKDVLFIFSSEIPRSQLADMFGIHKTTVGLIQRGKTWRKTTHDRNLS